jgi:hypothetical protein
MVQSPKHANKGGFNMILSGVRRGPPDLVAEAAKIIASADADFADLDDVIDVIVREKLWLNRVDQSGTSLESFVDLALAAEGLGLSTVKRMRPVRGSLLALGHYREVVELLRRTMRPRGRPAKKAVKDGIFRRFWPAPRSKGSVDYILLKLESDHPEAFAAVCDGREDYRDAARRLGLSSPSPPSSWSASDIAAISLLTPKEQGDLMCKLCGVVRVEAHCAMLSRIFERKLGPGLAEKWREGSEEQRTWQKPS